MSNHPFSMQGKVGIVAGLANEDSIAFGCAKALHAAEAEMLVTCASSKAKGSAVVYLAAPSGAALSGTTHYVDAGYHIRA